jgi:hypothetical protein
MFTRLGGDETGLVAYWRFMESADEQQVIDSSTQGLHGFRGVTRLLAEASEPDRFISDRLAPE